MGLVWTDLLLVAAGGGLGGVARYRLSGLVARHAGDVFPWGTLAVNVSGALAIGVMAGLVPGGGAYVEAPSAPWLALVVGVLGSYTTVSSFSLQTLALIQRGAPGRAVANVALSLALCLGAAALGYCAVVLATGG